jgi:hypothetical protein
MILPLLAVIPLYLLPSLIGWWRGMKRFPDLVMWNLSFGWTGVIWVAALIVAITE